MVGGASSQFLPLTPCSESLMTVSAVRASLQTLADGPRGNLQRNDQAIALMCNAMTKTPLDYSDQRWYHVERHNTAEKYVSLKRLGNPRLSG